MSPITPMQQRMLDTAIEYAVQQDVVFCNWPQFRDYLVENRCLGADELDEQQNFVFESYLKHNSAKKQDHFRHLDTPPKSPENEPRAAVCNPAAGLPLDPPFAPTLDTTQIKRSENLSIFVKHENNWDGTGWDFCTQDDSFISTRIVRRNSLEVKDQRTELSWKFHGEKKTYRTWFIVVEDENMEDDIMLGKNWENVESQTRAGPPSHGFGQDAEQPLDIGLPNEEHFPVQQAFLGTSHPPTHKECMPELEARVARMNVHSTLFMMDTLQPNPLTISLCYPPGPMPIRRHMEDARSESSISQGLHHEKRLAPSFVHDHHLRGSPKNPSFYAAVRPPEEPPPP